MASFRSILALFLLGSFAGSQEQQAGTVFSREGLFTAANILLCAMCALTLLGTMWPALSQAISGQSVGVLMSFAPKQLRSP